MNKKIISSIGHFLFDVILVAGIASGGFFANVSLFIFWCLILLTTALFITGKVWEIKKGNVNKISSATVIQWVGSLLGIAALFAYDHYITFVAYLLASVAVVIFRAMKNKGGEQ